MQSLHIAMHKCSSKAPKPATASPSTQTQQPALRVIHRRAPQRRLSISKRLNALELTPHLRRHHRPHRLILTVLILGMQLTAPVENFSRFLLCEWGGALIRIYKAGNHQRMSTVTNVPTVPQTACRTAGG